MLARHAAYRAGVHEAPPAVEVARDVATRLRTKDRQGQERRAAEPGRETGSTRAGSRRERAVPDPRLGGTPRGVCARRAAQYRCARRSRIRRGVVIPRCGRQDGRRRHRQRERDDDPQPPLPSSKPQPQTAVIRRIVRRNAGSDQRASQAAAAAGSPRSRTAVRAGRSSAAARRASRGRPARRRG